mmetsp:Transcript_32561/g.80968  ORF Transcript_32561/g.80968 Transcript_32561/m.80968 type:complete len:202 (-) Transcript_32561:645-1250(-)
MIPNCSLRPWPSALAPAGEQSCSSNARLEAKSGQCWFGGSKTPRIIRSGRTVVSCAEKSCSRPALSPAAHASIWSSTCPMKMPIEWRCASYSPPGSAAPALPLPPCIMCTICSVASASTRARSSSSSPGSRGSPCALSATNTSRSLTKLSLSMPDALNASSDTFSRIAARVCSACGGGEDCHDCRPTCRMCPRRSLSLPLG